MSSAGTRYLTLTQDNQAANIWVVALLCISFSTACLGVRVVSKFRFSFDFELDDYVFGLGWVVQVVQVGLLIKALVLGLGKDNSIIDQSNISSLEAFHTASRILMVVSLYMTKVSMILLIQRLFAQSLRRFWIITAVLGVVTAIELDVGCLYPKCTRSLPRVIVAAAFDIITEMIIIGLPVYCIRHLRMHRYRKAKVLLSFSSRTIIIIFACLGIWATTKVNPVTHYTTSIVLPIIFTQLQLCFSLSIAAILPCFRLIFQSSEKVPTPSNGYIREKKRHGSGASNQAASFGMSNVHNDNETVDTDSVHSRIATPQPPKSPEHSAQSSQDMSGAISNFTGRVSESSLVPSATTGLSARPLIQAPVV